MTPLSDRGPSDDVARAFSRHVVSWVAWIPFVCVLLVYLFAPRYLALGAQVIIMIIFALSLDLALGFGGIETLGHAALFGVGAYAAGLFARHVSPDPVLGLLAAAMAGTVTAFLSGLLVLRTRGLTLVMLTLAISVVILEMANSFKSLTGGADGLYGFQMAPIFGLFPFDLFGRTGYWYSAAVLAAVFFLCKALVNSPFGLTIEGIRENPVRMSLLGVPVTRRLVLLYSISGAFSGIAGGLSAQITQVVGLDSLAFSLSGNVLVMLILGGIGTLYGAIVGATVFVVISDRAAAISPFHWLFVLGAVLILAVRYAPSGLVGLLTARISKRLGRTSPG